MAVTSRGGAARVVPWGLRDAAVGHNGLIRRRTGGRWVARVMPPPSRDISLRERGGDAGSLLLPVTTAAASCARFEGRGAVPPAYGPAGLPLLEPASELVVAPRGGYA